MFPFLDTKHKHKLYSLFGYTYFTAEWVSFTNCGIFFRKEIVEIP